MSHPKHVSYSKGELVFHAVCVAVGAFALGILVATPEPGQNPLPACNTESSNNCYWDADVQGNGSGSDFVTIDNVVYYPVSPVSPVSGN